ncbi:hypothetical protein [Microbacterium sp. JZ101]
MSAPRAATHPPRPAALHIGVGLMVFTCLLGLTFGILGFVDASDHGDEEGAALFLIAAAVVVVDLVLAILVWFGRMWARTVLTVIVIGNMLLGIFTGQGPTGLLGVAAVAVLYLKPCTEWLQEARPSE